MTSEQAISYLENMKWLKGYDNTTVNGKTLDGVIDGIVELLKAQEPRLMKLEEVARSAFCWVEDEDILFPALFVGMEKRANGQKCDVFLADRPDSEDCEFWFDLDSYGMFWRCWTSHPTDKQREVEPWN